MYRKMASSWRKHLDFILLDILCIEAAFLLASILRNGLDSLLINFRYGEMIINIIFANLAIVFFTEGYRGILRRGLLKEFKATLMHTTLVSIVTVVLIVLLKKTVYSRLELVLMWLFSIILCYGARIARKRYLICKKKVKESKKCSLMIVTSSDRAESVVEHISGNNFESFLIVGVCVLDKEMRGEEIAGVPVVANEEDVLEYICKNWVDEVFLNVSQQLPLADTLINSCVEMGVTVHLQLAKIATLSGPKQVVEKFAGYTVLSTSINMATDRQAFMKRSLDIMGGIVGTAITGILFLFLAPCIYIKSPGPIFFSQWRVGKNGKLFKIHKFRSMYMDAEERKQELMEKNKMKDGLMFKIDNDPRIIGGENGKGIGNFIRNTSLDEFPQFWNVLKGEMSMVGTRPPTTDEWEQYDLHHRRRLATKPGLTGLWQVSGRSDITDFEEVVALDTKYITEWSLGLDIKILFRTVLVVLRGDGSM